MKTVLITGEQFYFSLSRLIFVSHEILIEIISLESFNDTLVPYGGKYWTVSLLEIDKKNLIWSVVMWWNVYRSVVFV